MPRKTGGRPWRPSSGRPASMRPRPDAAENRWLAGRFRLASQRASMRPRPDAAENRQQFALEQSRLLGLQ